MLTMIGTALPPARRVRQGAAPARTGARERTNGVRAGSRTRRADARRSRRRPRRQGGLRQRRAQPRTGAGHAPQAARRGARGRRGHTVELGRVYRIRASTSARNRCIAKRWRFGEGARGRSRETAVSLSDLASVLRLNGDLAGAESLLRQAWRSTARPAAKITRTRASTLHDSG